MKTVTEHRIEFRCPGTFVDEHVTRIVTKEQLTIEHAVEIYDDMVARYNSKPYGFYLVTEVHGEFERDGKVFSSPAEISRSGCHFINGTVLTLDDIPDTEENSILRSNMKGNNIPAVVRTTNSYKHTGELGKRDVVLQGTEIVARGSDYHKED
jgi:hypothetical protein